MLNLPQAAVSTGITTLSVLGSLLGLSAVQFQVPSDPCIEVRQSAATTARLFQQRQTAGADAQHRRTLSILRSLSDLDLISCAIAAQAQFDFSKPQSYPPYITEYSDLAVQAALRVGQLEAAGIHLGMIAAIDWSGNRFPEAMRAFLTFGSVAEAFTAFRIDAPNNELIRESLNFKDLLRRYVRFMFNTSQAHPALCAEHKCLDLAWQMTEHIKSRLFRTNVTRAAILALEPKRRQLVSDLLMRERQLRLQRISGVPTATYQSQLSALSDQVTALLPEYRTLWANPPTADDVRRRLSPDETFVSFFYTDTEKPVYATKITAAAGVESIRLPITTVELYIDIEGLKVDIEHGKTLADLDPILRAISHSIIDPLNLPARGTLIVATDLNISSLPFDLLPLKSGQLMMDAFAIHYVPSASIFVGQRSRATATSATARAYRYSYTGFSFKGLRGDLTYANVEIRNGARGFSDSLVITDATEGDLYKHADRIRSSRILHIVAHSASLDSDQGTVYLEFAPDSIEDGRLTGIEIMRKLANDAEVVILSACQTALPSDSYAAGRVIAQGTGDSRRYLVNGCICSYGESFSDLTSAFFAAGSRQLVLTQWLLPDADQTQDFVSRFLEQLRPESSPAEVLRATKRKFRREYPPVFWAGFVSVGA